MNIVPVAAPLPVNSAVNDKKMADAQQDTFKGIFDKALQNLNEKQIVSQETVKSFLTGEIQDVHTVIIAGEEAKLTMQLAVEVRNKVIEAYQEISRMQV